MYTTHQPHFFCRRPKEKEFGGIVVQALMFLTMQTVCLWLVWMRRKSGKKANAKHFLKTCAFSQKLLQAEERFIIDQHKRSIMCQVPKKSKCLTHTPLHDRNASIVSTRDLLHNSRCHGSPRPCQIAGKDSETLHLVCYPQDRGTSTSA